MKRPRVLLADDHAMFADGVRRILEPDFEYIGTVEDGRALLDEAEKHRPDVILLDISMPELNGIEAARHLKKAGSNAKVVMLTMHADASFASEAFEAGAAGYLLKHCAADELLTAIREVLKGRTYITPRIAGGLLDTLMTRGRKTAARPSVNLTGREREVLQLLAEGRTVKEIAATLNISPRTAEFHKYNIMEKLDLRTTAELTQYAVKHGIVST